MTKSPEYIHCPKCSKPTKATRIGAQDACDVYTCKNEHLIIIKVGAPRKIWDELASVHNGSTQGT